MSAKPTPEMRALFTKAAKRWNVPITLLMAIARVETGFNPAFAAPAPSTGRGMFGATDAMRAAVSGYMPAGASDLEQQITLAAVFLSVYLDDAMWKGHRPGAIVSFFYAKADPAPWDGAIESGAGRTALLRPKNDGDKVVMPADAARYLEAVQKARADFSDEGTVRGTSNVEKLYFAMAGLEAANTPEWCARKLGTNPPHIVFSEQMATVREWYEWTRPEASKPLDPTNIVLNTGPLDKMWGFYEVFFELAPVTDHNTPAPKRVVPASMLRPLEDLAAITGSSFSAAAKWIDERLNAGKTFAKEGLERMDKFGAELGEELGDIGRAVGIGAGVLIFALGTVYIIVNRRTA